MKDDSNDISRPEPTSGSYFLSLPIFCDNSEMEIEVTETLYQTNSKFQDILIVNTPKFGKCLIIDGVMQSAESDHALYDHALLSQLRQNDRNILILGGGDGFIAETALNQNPTLRVTMIDLDPVVIQGAQLALGQKVFGDPRLNLVIGDAVHFLKTDTAIYDGIVCDLTDTPIGTNSEREKFEAFFQEVIASAKERLDQDGWISIQAGATIATDKFIDEADIIGAILAEHFGHVSKADIHIPSYGETCSFLHAGKMKSDAR
jgi:spermidine synthase